MNRFHQAAALFTLAFAASCTEQGDETSYFKTQNTSQSATASTTVVVRERWLAYLADELTTGPGGTDFNGDSDEFDQIAVLINMVSERQTRLGVAAQELAVIGKHLYLVTDEVLDGRNWNGDGDSLDLVLLTTPCENAAFTTVQYVATLTRAGTGSRMLSTDNDRLLYTDDPSTDPLLGAETSLSMIKLSGGVPQAPVRLLNEDNLTTLQPRLMGRSAGIVAVLLDESVELRDLNGDADAADSFVLGLVDTTATTPEVKSVGLALSGGATPFAALDITGGETVVAARQPAVQVGELVEAQVVLHALVRALAHLAQVGVGVVLRAARHHGRTGLGAEVVRRGVVAASGGGHHQHDRHGEARQLAGQATGARAHGATVPAGSRPASSRARATTASSIGSVSRPVKVFCWLTWYEQRIVRPSPAGTSSPWANRGRGRTPSRPATTP